MEILLEYITKDNLVAMVMTIGLLYSIKKIENLVKEKNKLIVEKDLIYKEYLQYVKDQKENMEGVHQKTVETLVTATNTLDHLESIIDKLVLQKYLQEK